MAKNCIPERNSAFTYRFVHVFFPDLVVQFKPLCTFAAKPVPIISIRERGHNRESCENQEQYPLL